jgi:hypothetical protein
MDIGNGQRGGGETGTPMPREIIIWYETGVGGVDGIQVAGEGISSSH